MKFHKISGEPKKNKCNNNYKINKAEKVLINHNNMPKISLLKVFYLKLYFYLLKQMSPKNILVNHY